MTIERVSYKQVYDLVFRARNARLDPATYSLDYLDWVRAGIGHNTRGSELESRKVSVFVKLLNIIKKVKSDFTNLMTEEVETLGSSFPMFYEDLYAIYQDFIASVQRMTKLSGKRQAPEFGELLVLPSFDLVPELSNIFTVVTEHVEEYTCRYEDLFLENVNSIYLRADTSLYKSMAMMYDYGVRKCGSGVLLEVLQWERV